MDTLDFILNNSYLEEFDPVCDECGESLLGKSEVREGLCEECQDKRREQWIR